MKNVQQIVMALVIITAAGVTSCRKSALPEPAVKTTTGDTAETQLNALVPAAKFRLTKQGNTYLHYQADGRLWKVVFSPTNYITYFWVANGVEATNYIDNKKYSTNTIMINDNGKCYYSTFKKYKDNLVDFEWAWKFQYTNNKLTKQVNPNDADERYEYSYNGDGDLTKISYYDQQGTLTHTAQYTYQTSWISPAVDKSPINPETAEVERYLQLYGKFSGYLVKKLVTTYVPTNKITTNNTFSYVFDNNGYVSKRYRLSGVNIEETSEYQYQQIR